MSVIFVAGIHGIGKTTMCAHVENILGIPHYSASALIKKQRVDLVQEQNKLVPDIGLNQALLIQGIREVCNSNNSTILLDGHFTLLRSNEEVESISIEVFRALSLKAILVLKDEPSEVMNRLRERDSSACTVDILQKHQELELKRAYLVARQLNIPIREVRAFDQVEFMKRISEWNEVSSFTNSR